MRVPVPIHPGPQDLPYWEAARGGELSLQACARCGLTRHPPAPICAGCSSMEVTWATVPGTGMLVAHVVFHKAYSPALVPDLPYAVGLIRLDDGPLFVSRLLGRDPSTWRSGQRVRVAFHVQVGDWRLPCFEADGDQEAQR